MPLPPSVRLVEGDGRLPRLDVSSRLATAQVYLHGAHVTSWHPSHTPVPVLWLSGHSLFQENKPIRGGVPICFPWFGPHASDPNAPAHGFARMTDWAVTDAEESDDGTVTLSLSLQPEDSMSDVWPYPFRITHRIRIGTQLTMELEVENRGIDAFTFEEALHSYFAVQDVTRIAITGLHKAEYLDKVADFARRIQEQERIRFTSETDRVYVDTTAACGIDDPGLDRRILVSKSGSESTIVWNPWTDKARAMADFGDLEWQRMVCVESGNVGTAAIRLHPGEMHRMAATIDVQRAQPPADSTNQR